MCLIPVFLRQRQAGVYEFEAILVFIVRVPDHPSYTVRPKSNSKQTDKPWNTE